MKNLKSKFENHSQTAENFETENEVLRRRMEEAEETIRAIQSGAVDALVVEEPSGHRVYTLETADRPYRLFVEQMQQGAATVQADGTIAYCNRQFTNLLKVPYEKLVGAVLGDFVASEDRAFYEKLLGQGRTRSGSGEARLRRANGDLVPVYLTFNPLPKDCGAVLGVLVTDLTTQRHHEQLAAAHPAMRESERRLREIVDALPAAIYTTDAQGRLTHFNPACVAFSGRSPQLGSDHWCVTWKLFYPDGRPMRHDECPMAISLRERRPVRGVETIAERPDGTRIWFQPYPTPLFDHDGNLTGGINMLVDITERKRAEKQIQHLNQELEQRVMERTRDLAAANRELEAFCYSVSHDLRTPLRGIDGFSELLLKNHWAGLDGQGKSYLERVRAASQRMAQLIDDLLNLSRLTRNEMQLKEIDISAASVDVVTELKRSEPGRRVDFRIEPGLKCNGDEKLIRIALTNLFGNAWKFTCKHANARIEFGMLEQGGELVYFVRDDGAGFDMEYAGNLFKPFQRLHNDAEFPGTGIGLATVQRIINRHGGRIWAEGEVEKGATIYFTLAPSATAGRKSGGR